jgi:AcrR family transcriptional regulator
VDHDQRRRKIAEVVIRVIASEGLNAATIRRIAAEVGFSTTVITHYFADKQDMLLWAYRTMGQYALGRFEGGITQDAGALVDMLITMTAADETNMALWRTYVAIWDRWLHDPVFAPELKSWTDAITTRVAAYIRLLNPTCADAEGSARQLLAMVQGISIQRLFDRESWTYETVREALARQVELALAPLAIPAQSG